MSQKLYRIASALSAGNLNAVFPLQRKIVQRLTGPGVTEKITGVKGGW
jgi:hypothetical protein